MPKKKGNILNNKSQIVSRTGKKINSKLNNLKLNNNNRLYNLNTVKSDVHNFLIILIVITIIYILYLSFIIYYINQLKTCSCFKTDETNSINLQYLIIIESIKLAFQIVILLYILSLIVKVKNFSGGNLKSNNNSIGRYIYLVLYLLINGYFIYYVYLISKNIKEDCKCSNSSLRYLLYLQTFIMFFNLILIFIGIFNYIIKV